MANKRFIDFPIATTVGDNDIILIWQGGANKQTTKATILSGVPDSLNDLTDVTISGLTNGQILRYDSVTGQWENTDQGNLDLNDLNDVTIVSPTNGQVLVYNSSTSKWENSSGGYVPYVGAVTTVNLGAQTIQAGSFVKQSGTSSQFLKADGSVDSTAYGTGSVTSVGLTMPAAFNVANSPVTTAGTLAVTGAGTVAQYIRGDGSLADFPESSGGGSSVSYYLNGSVDQGTIGGIAYKELSKVPILGAGTDFTINADGYIASFITDAGEPNLLEIPGGNWNFETYFSASSGGGSPTFYVELYKVSGTTATLIASSSSAPELIAFGTNLTPYFSSLAVPTTTLALTDRLAVRYYVTHSGRTITLHTENNHLCQIITTFTTGLTALNGLTAQVQNFAVGTTGTDFNIASATATHTFNLPTASATNRGALSSADWSLFTQAYNDKINSAAVTGTTTKTLTLTQQDGGTITASWSDLNTDAVLSVFGRTGAVVAANGDYTTAQVTESGNLYYTDARSRAALSFAAGSGAYNTSTGVITIPTNNNQITNGAGYITSAALGAYLPLIGGTMTGNINWGQTDRGLTWLFNTDGASIKFYNTGDGDTNSRLEFATLDNNNEYFRWVHIPDGGTTYESMRLVPNSSGNAQLIVSGSIIKQGGTSSQYLMADGSVSTLTNPVTGTGTTNYLPKFTGTSTIGNSALQETSGNLGLGVTPSAWFSTVRAIDISTATALWAGGNGQPALGYNVFVNTSGNLIYKTSEFASRYEQISGQHQWFTAPSGTAGNAISFTQAMTLFATGNLLVGTPSPISDNGARLQVSGEGRFYQPLTNTTSYLTVENNRARNAAIRLKTTVGDFYLGTGIGADVNQFQLFDGTAGVNRLVISSTGNVGIGTPSPGQKLQVNGRIRVSGSGGDGGDMAVDDGGIAFSTQGSTPIAFWRDNYTNQSMRIFAGGNVFIGSSPSDNGARFQVSGNARFTRANDSGSILRLESVGNNGFDFSRNQSNGALEIQGSQTGFNNIVLAPTSGNIGIGTSSPTSGRLEIQQTTTTAALWVQTGGTSASHVIADFRTGTNLPALQILGNGASTFGGSLALPHTTKSANYTLTATDYTVGFDCASNRTANLPDATTCAGRIYVIYQYNTGNLGSRYVTLDGNGSQTINGLTTVSLQYYYDYSSLMIQSNGSNWIIIADAAYPVPV